MGRGLNKVTLLGNLGADPDIRETKSGMAVANLRLATAESRKDGDQWVDHTEWHRIVAFGRTAEVCRDYLAKGKQILVEGKLRTSKYEKDGVEKYSTEIVCDNLIMLGGKGDGGSMPQSTHASGAAAGGAPMDSADIPFDRTL